MIKIPATRIVAAGFALLGLAAASRLDLGETDTAVAIPASRIPAPEFRVQRLQDELILSGHTLSQQHEKDLLQLVAESYPGEPLVTAFEPLGAVPDFWADATGQITYLLAETASAQAILSTGALRIRALVVDQPAWQDRLAGVTRSLPASIIINSDAVVIDDSIAVPGLCERAFTEFNPGPINFEESGTQLRNSAYPRLDRVVALADACRDSLVHITGYTDASGNEARNLKLSQDRAALVADYLQSRGIDRKRLLVRGAGSSVAIADNESRYGRGRNRRIEIEFSNP